MRHSLLLSFLLSFLLAFVSLAPVARAQAPEFTARCTIDAHGLRCYARNVGTHTGIPGLMVAVTRVDSPDVSWGGTTTYGEEPEIAPGEEKELAIAYSAQRGEEDADAGPGTNAEAISRFCLDGPAHAYSDCQVQAAPEVMDDTSVAAKLVRWGPLSFGLLLLFGATFWTYRDANALGGSGGAWAIAVFALCGIAFPVYLLFGRRSLKKARAAMQAAVGPDAPPGDG